MSNKRLAKQRRARLTRAKIARLGVVRLAVYRTSKHIYAQLIDVSGNVLASASTVEKAVLKLCDGGYGGNKAAATVVGKCVAERAIKAGVKQVAFDRSGYKYHGRVKMLAEAAREAGLIF